MGWLTSLLRSTSIGGPSKVQKIIAWPLSPVISGGICSHGPASLPDFERAHVSTYSRLWLRYEVQSMISVPLRVRKSSGPSVT